VHSRYPKVDAKRRRLLASLRAELTP
jgi:hypothetical protein